MKVDIIHSGSSGNCAVIDETLIIDIGWNVYPKGTYVLLTHFHTDHTKHLINVGGLPVYCTQETANKLEEKFPYNAFNIIEAGCAYDIGKFRVLPLTLKHDAPCVGFDIYDLDEDKRIFFATDFNEIVNENLFIKYLKDKTYDALYIEGNNTLSPTDFHDVYFHDENEKPPKDEFHRRKSFQNHCNIDYLISLFIRAGYSAENRFTEPVTLLHKSSYYYTQNVERIAELCKIANITNPLY